MKQPKQGLRRRRPPIYVVLLGVAAFTGVGLLLLALRSADPTSAGFIIRQERRPSDSEADLSWSIGDGSVLERNDTDKEKKKRKKKSCATVEEMGESFSASPWKESLRVRRLIHRHFLINGAERVRKLPAEQFCRHGFVLGKASEAGFGNEMYKILNGAALSVLLNRSLIIGKTRKKFPFGDYVAYSNISFTLNEVKHLWRLNGCIDKYGRHLVMRTDDFVKPAKSNVLCSNWKKWDEAIIWFQNTTDAVATQFFLKNVHQEMKDAASDLFGQPELLDSRPNVFGELMRVLIAPSKDVEEAVNWVLGGRADPDISLHMRMLMNRPVKASRAALNCIKRAMETLPQSPRPWVVLVSDTPSFVDSILPNITEFAEVVRFDYKQFQGNISQHVNGSRALDFRAKDWGPAPRWVAFVDFFLAARAKYSVVSGAHRRVGTTYAQLIAALAAANRLGETSAASNFSFLSSFQKNLLTDGLRLQVGWGHVWNRYAGPLSCRNQPHQCAFTPLLPPAWWDGLWQSPISRDIRRLAAFGVKLSGFGTIDGSYLRSHCKSRKTTVETTAIL